MNRITTILLAGFSLAFTASAQHPAFFAGELIDDRVRVDYQIVNGTPVSNFYKTFELLPEIPAVETRKVVTRESRTFFGIPFKTRGVAFSLPQSEIDLIAQTAEAGDWPPERIIKVLEDYDRSKVWAARKQLGVDYFIPANPL